MGETEMEKHSLNKVELALYTNLRILMHNQGCQSCQHPNAEVLVRLILPIVAHHIGLPVTKETKTFDNYIVYTYNHLTKTQSQSQVLYSFSSTQGGKRERAGIKVRNIFIVLKLRDEAQNHFLQRTIQLTNYNSRELGKGK